MKRTRDLMVVDTPSVIEILPIDVWTLIVACENTDANKYASLHSFACLCQSSRIIARAILLSLYANQSISAIMKCQSDHPIRAYHILFETQMKKYKQPSVVTEYVDTIRLILLRYVCNQYTRQLLSTIFIGDNVDSETIAPSYDMHHTDRIKWMNAVIERHKKKETIAYDTVRSITETFERITEAMRLSSRPYSKTRMLWTEPVNLRLVAIRDLDNECDLYRLYASHPSLQPPRYECHIVDIG